MMFRTALMMVLAMFVAGCGGGVPELDEPLKTMEDGPGASSDNGGSGGADDITGIWRYEYTDTGCIEEIRFLSSGQFQISSLDEFITGTYTTQVTSVYVRSNLNLSYLSDNGGADCTGVSDFDAPQYAVWYYEIKAGRLNIYYASSGDLLVRSYVRS